MSVGGITGMTECLTNALCLAQEMCSPRGRSSQLLPKQAECGAGKREFHNGMSTVKIRINLDRDF